MPQKIALACERCHARNYSTVKTAAANAERLAIKKYCKTCGQHSVHRETK
ncbi:50S ribosomal protein L33 [Salisediminibacterium halotolerans]|nr:MULTISPECIES: 50S ribosomal protein L33 [Salisediminibacterium]RLJ73060.1 LSU ribosomal protein L33P [Actinophytocola xinjiangensis]RPE86482.1 LSU ribosomal protein L33P [Salisediminibacterium halotolerans]TWG33857.1 LSU ribosomal protein L33P [Salisediminibacterium halotolerans]